jgi:hypothetical protein
MMPASANIPGFNGYPRLTTRILVSKVREAGELIDGSIEDPIGIGDDRDLHRLTSPHLSDLLLRNVDHDFDNVHIHDLKERRRRIGRRTFLGQDGFDDSGDGRLHLDGGEFQSRLIPVDYGQYLIFLYIITLLDLDLNDLAVNGGQDADFFFRVHRTVQGEGFPDVLPLGRRDGYRDRELLLRRLLRSAGPRPKGQKAQTRSFSALGKQTGVTEIPAHGDRRYDYDKDN